MKRSHIALILSALLLLFITPIAVAGETGDKTIAVIESINAGDEYALMGLLSAEAREMMSAEQIKSGWDAMVVQLGALKSYEVETESDASAVIACVHENGATRFTCTFDEDGLVKTFSIMPSAYGNAEPLPNDLPDGATEQKVTLFDGTEKKLDGILTLPKDCNADTPVAVLVQGSGPSDMDETIGPNKPFRDIAAGLAGMGVACVRYDKITYAHPELFTDIGRFTVYYEEVEPALEALRIVNEMGFSNVYVIGHSMGGMLTPYIISESDGGFAGGVIMAGSPRKLWRIMYEQNVQMIIESQGAVDEETQKTLDDMAALAESICAMTREEAMASDDQAMGMPAYYLWSIDSIDRAKLALEIAKPLLILQGHDDFQVWLDADFQAWKDALGESDLYEYISYPGLNHFFMPAREGYGLSNMNEAYQVPSVVDAKVIEDIGDWINAR